ncbi:MAG: DNA helicase RecG [Candidatus Portnoybacteria bacterium CG10_big_fil_rev_8_21_14_0_10_44_7]|uniref:ATP-dependent DNA helicase RecG n=1 Tax=Candidatus Portnoybacteria bacterium CG10_big_fil_rev_8_21_14_0_10_44_7 TaxID=1974816 RepID=A0A2M8KIN6_9BACT|nr:MAG: DNA helicase RecG [Candidatus Portnoybacteria bacterium CG10_big_fil_rev_8_21_14_0_10_44_7]
MDIFEQPIEKITKVSIPYLNRLHQVGVFSLKDLFYYFPARYIDFSLVVPIAKLRPEEPATVSGQILNTKNSRTWKKRMSLTEAVIQDDSGFLRAVWFNQPFITKNLRRGDRVNLAGKLTTYKNQPVFANPAYEKLWGQKTKDTGRIIPIYHETRGLTSRWLRFFLRKNLDQFLNQIPEILPAKIQQTEKLLSLPAALGEIHFPKSNKSLRAARERLAFEEMFLIQLHLLRQKIVRRGQKALKIAFDQKLIKGFVANLPFTLTPAQRKSTWEILRDLQKEMPMNRLLEGDVGSGKTVVAAIALLQTAQNGFQAALMAPTEILARQHYKTLSPLLLKRKIKIALLTGKDALVGAKKTTKKDLLFKIKQGKIAVAVGTHALIQKQVAFKNLALSIVDEQHRFGVAQRAALQKNILEIKDGLSKTIPHFLSMTATPIPRTLALALYGDLEISLLDELPKNRKSIKTFVVPPVKRNGAYDFIRREIKAGRQAFVVCPRIEKSAANSEITTDKRKLVWQDVKAVEEEYARLKEQVFPDLKIAKIHGRLKPAEKEKIMLAFRTGQIDILVSTSVIEVGVDMPNASVIMIENADRFGLAQLHQFRGRVGRSSHQSYCFLFTQSKQPETTKRLWALTTAKDGFALAEIDLKLRGPGEFLSARQSGLPDLAMASLTNVALIKKAKQYAAQTIAADLKLQKEPFLKKHLAGFAKRMHPE